MSGEDGNEEFYRQLQLQQQYGAERGGEGEGEGEAAPDPFTYVDPADGAAYEWDREKKAWFPKITEDFLATYHANYGFHADDTDSSSASGTATDSKLPVSSKTSDTQPLANEKGPKQTDPKQKSEKRKLEPGWFHVEEDRNTNVYVTGLPPDITKDEFVQVMSKCGIIMRDPQTEEHKIKLYKDKEGNLKGDGLCCYLKRESVQLALRLLDEAEIRGYKLHVEVAKFQLKGEYDASKKKKKCKDYKKKLSQQQKQLDWRPEKKDGAARMRHERIVIIRNMFHPKDFEEDPLVLNEIREDLRTECEKFGQVKKVLIFDRHPDGVASVSFKEATEADLCKLTLNGRWFGGRQLSAETWDGVTDYQVEETAREREERLKVWGSFLEDPDAKEQQTTSDSDSATSSVKMPEGRQPSKVNDTSKEDVNDEAHKRENNGEGINEDGAPSTDSSLAGSDVEADT
ncbi:17S U2 SnRNP complex component HTATSF1 [Anser cygnoides]|uniref:17S U2 SnRNP complex component HTATSF1 n=1 Tax=Anser cygnoides TaxID=8845 RepID=A0A8B9DAZ6_ANSCY|nr:HIV Tat-specific factor 1 [Anser cygnoides]